jgi:hypothetical protein
MGNGSESEQASGFGISTAMAALGIVKDEHSDAIQEHVI